MWRYWPLPLVLVALPAARADWLAERVAREQARYQQQCAARAVAPSPPPVTGARPPCPHPFLSRIESAATPSSRAQPLRPPPPVRAASPAHPEKAKDYDPIIRQYAIRYRLPKRLVQALIQVESGHRPGAVSPKGAIGLMQLMPGTAKRFGVSDPRDPAQNIAGGTRYLAWLLDTFENDLVLALAGYNAGEEAVRRYGGSVPPYRETRRYVRRVLSFYTRGAPHRD